MLLLKAFLSERLTAAAEDIFGAVEKTIAEYKEEICRSKDLEISRLRLELKLLKSGRFELNPLPAKPPHPLVTVYIFLSKKLIPLVSFVF